MFFLRSVIVAGIFGLVNSAYAQEKPQRDGASSWTGAYVGVHAGAASSNFLASSLPSTLPFSNWWTSGPSGEFQLGKQSLLGGVQLGYQRQFQELVVGLDLSGTLANLRRSRISPYFPAVDRQVGYVRAPLTVSLKLGRATGAFLPYFKVGYAGSATKFAAADAFGNFYSQKRFTGGVALGFGLDYKLTDHVVLGAEYSWTKLMPTTGSGLTRPVGFRERYEVEAAVHSLKLNLSYLFPVR